MSFPKNLHDVCSVFSAVPNVLQGQDLEFGFRVNAKPNAVPTINGPAEHGQAEIPQILDKEKLQAVIFNLIPERHFGISLSCMR